MVEALPLGAATLAIDIHNRRSKESEKRKSQLILLIQTEFMLQDLPSTFGQEFTKT